MKDGEENILDNGCLLVVSRFFAPWQHKLNQQYLLLLTRRWVPGHSFTSLLHDQTVRALKTFTKYFS